MYWNMQGKSCRRVLGELGGMHSLCMDFVIFCVSDRDWFGTV